MCCDKVVFVVVVFSKNNNFLIENGSWQGGVCVFIFLSKLKKHFLLENGSWQGCVCVYVYFSI